MPNSLKFYNAWFCPFAQRVWIALLHKGVAFEYVEQDPYNKSAEWLAINPRGLVPVLIHDGRAITESPIVIEYIQDMWPDTGNVLLPSDPYLRAKTRLLSDHISKKIVPQYYTCLQRQEQAEQDVAKENILTAIVTLMKEADPVGPFLIGKYFSMADIMLAPYAHRFDVVLSHFRGFQIPGQNGCENKSSETHAEEFERYAVWWAAVQGVAAYKDTLQDRQRLIDSYGRYANNSVKSEVGDAIRKGTALP